MIRLNIVEVKVKYYNINDLEFANQQKMKSLDLGLNKIFSKPH